MTDTEKRLFAGLVSLLLLVCSTLFGATAWYAKKLVERVDTAAGNYTRMELALDDALDRIEAVAQAVPLPPKPEEETE